MKRIFPSLKTCGMNYKKNAGAWRHAPWRKDNNFFPISERPGACQPELSKEVMREGFANAMRASRRLFPRLDTSRRVHPLTFFPAGSPVLSTRVPQTNSGGTRRTSIHSTNSKKIVIRRVRCSIQVED